MHRLGLKLGIYGDAGTMTCAGYPGSLGKEKLDAQTWADWGVDYLKYDNCYNQSDGSREDYVRRYTAMREAIDETGRPMVYSICEWGQSKPWEWATGVGHLWRTTGDISDNWSSLRSIIAFIESRSAWRSFRDARGATTTWRVARRRGPGALGACRRRTTCA